MEGQRRAETRWVDVDPPRLVGWVGRFGERHGGRPTAILAGRTVVLTAPDGETAECHAPPGAAVPARRLEGDDLIVEFAALAARSRTIGLVLVRRGGFAVGIATGGNLTASKVDTRYVQGRTAAGGWSQQRFARRRDNQTRALTGEAAEVCVRILLPRVGDLVSVVTGGDRASIAAVLADTRLTRLRAQISERFLPVGDPRLDVLRSAVVTARAVHIRVSSAPG
jgi:hypothetical protein